MKPAAHKVRWLLFLLLAAAAFVWWRTTPGPRFPARPEGKPLGQAAADWRLTALDGKEVRLGDFHGQVVFLNVWATWCGPCVGEVPSIERLYDEMKDQGVAFVLVSDERPDQVRRFVEQKGWRVPVYTSAVPPPPPFRTSGIPATFILDRQGAVAMQQVGATDWNSEGCKSFLRGLR